MTVGMNEGIFCYFSYREHSDGENETEKSCLMFAITTPAALDSALMNAPVRGLGIDSSWRALNENVAPLTFLVTVNDCERVEPGMYYIPTFQDTGLVLTPVT